jgi:hypothetical protein
MVIAYISGGLGNQMFQYAMARRLAHHHGVDLKLDLSQYKNGTDRRPGFEQFQRQLRLDQYSIQASAAAPDELSAFRDRFFQPSVSTSIAWRIRRVVPGFLWPKSHVREKFYRFDPGALHLPANVYVEGFWQSEKYFSDVAELIRAELSPKDPGITSYAEKYVDQLRVNGNPVVSIHVRRGDLAYADSQVATRGLLHGKPVGLEYIKAAIDRFSDSCNFLVFSDTAEDIEWCKENIDGRRLSFCEGHSDVQDLAIMSSCDHNIIANSTYSWWAAWLNPRPRKRVVAPRTWSHQVGKLAIVIDDLIPPGWEILD